MSDASLAAWTAKRLKADATLTLLTALGAFAGGLVVVFLTFWFTYAILYVCAIGANALLDLVLSKRIEISHVMRLWLSGGVMALLFFTHWRMDEHYWGESTGEDCSPHLPGSGTTGALVQMAAHPRTSARMIVDILLTGPRLLASTRGFWIRAKRLRELDAGRASSLFALLWGRGHAMTWEELEAQGLTETARNLEGISGIVYLQKGVSLTDELRTELTEALAPQN